MGIEGWSVEDVREAMSGLSDQDRIALLGLLAGRRSVWYSLPGPQSDARYSEADVVGYGGAAGGGKSDLLCGVAIVDHSKTTIFRRETTQLLPIQERFEEILGTNSGFNGQKNVWRLGGGRRVRFAGFPNVGDEKRQQGGSNDLVAFDEAAEMLEEQVRFVIGWNRSPRRNQRCRVILTFNPPTTPEGRWIIKYFAPWLDKRFPGGRAEPGELRWVTTIAGEDRWLPVERGGQPFVLVEGRIVYDFDPAKHRKEDIIRPMSRTFIPARVVDNPFLSDEYLSRLQSHPEPLRSQMLYGDFEAGMEDDAWQVIPTAWVRASMDRWRPRNHNGFRPGPMDSMGVDVAMGGKDKFVIARRHGRWFDDLIRLKGRLVTSGSTGAGEVIKARRDRAPVHVDVVGWGAATYEALIGNNVQAMPINGANRSDKVTESGQRFVNKRAELVWAVREALDPDGPDPIDLPDDAGLELDLTSYRWTPTRSGILVRSKEEMRKELGHSPDDGDAVCLALEETIKDDVVIDVLDRRLAHSYDVEYNRAEI